MNLSDCSGSELEQQEGRPATASDPRVRSSGWLLIRNPLYRGLQALSPWRGSAPAPREQPHNPSPRPDPQAGTPLRILDSSQPLFLSAPRAEPAQVSMDAGRSKGNAGRGGEGDFPITCTGVGASAGAGTAADAALPPVDPVLMQQFQMFAYLVQQQQLQQRQPGQQKAASGT